MIHIILTSYDLEIYPFCRTYSAILKTNNAFNSILYKYLDLIYILSENLIAKIIKYIEMINYIFNLLEAKLLLYKSIFSLKLIKFLIVKI